MNSAIGIGLDGLSATLDLSSFPVETTILQERLSQIVTVLECVLAADLARERLSDCLHEKLLPLILAKDLLYQASLAASEAEAGDMLMIINQELTAHDVGFPELDAPAGKYD
jgi:hypothetical protein